MDWGLSVVYCVVDEEYVMSGDYISREAVITAIMEDTPEKRYPIYYMEKIAHLPTADVVELKKSFWRRDAISTNDGLSHVFGFRCYNCFGFCIGASKYCPNCGAIMSDA